jgi:poly(3-hydroxybutyrate) depolymerase
MKHLLLATLAFTSAAFAGEPPPVLNIDGSRITVSGISSGAHMAHQLHIAYSDLFSGAAILSGGPYGCAENSLMTAMSRCVKSADEPLPTGELIERVRSAAAEGRVADPANLADDRVWMFHGTEDREVAAEVHEAAATVYSAFLPDRQIRRVDDVPAGHVFPAAGRGHGCTELVPPFVGDCGYDAAGQLLQYLYPGLEAPAAVVTAELREVALAGAEDAELLETAYLFVPAGCAGGERACALHLVLHGCAQSAESVGAAFIEASGYLPWAEANGIIMAFPQVEESLISPVNPLGCWDWWGYTGEDYLWRSGRQMTVLTDWIARLRNNPGHKP